VLANVSKNLPGGIHPYPCIWTDRQTNRQMDRHDEDDSHFSQLLCEHNILGCKYGAEGKSGRNKVQNQAKKYKTHHFDME
jgi:hypothetical protein